MNESVGYYSAINYDLLRDHQSFCSPLTTDYAQHVPCPRAEWYCERVSGSDDVDHGNGDSGGGRRSGGGGGASDSFTPASHNEATDHGRVTVLVIPHLHSHYACISTHNQYYYAPIPPQCIPTPQSEHLAYVDNDAQTTQKHMH